MENEIWQVEVNGEIYECEFSELKQWIAERSLMPQDSVRKPNRNWIPAGRVPVLARFFRELSTETAAQIPVQTVATAANIQPVQAFAPQTNFQPAAPTNFDAPQTFPHRQNTAANDCYNHAGEAAAFVCRNCANLFCKSCPKTYGTVRVCPVCGDMCDAMKEAREKAQKSSRQQQSQSGFGFEDFGEAFVYPFKFVGSLFLGSLFYAFLLMGGVYGGLLANTILFGCISLTIGQIAHGNLNRSFMPDFDDFSMWDDVIKPFFLSLGINLVCWLPTLLVLGVFVWGAIGAFTTARENVKNGKSAPASPVIIVEGVEMQAPVDDKEYANAPRVELTKDEHEAIGSRPGSEAAQRAFRKIQIAEQKFAYAKELGFDMDATKSTPEIALDFVRKGWAKGLAQIIICLFLSLVWGVFYYPMALTIAGYTRSVLAVINPLVGFDTMRRMGANYIKAFLMCLTIIIFGNIIGIVIGIITAPFNLPLVGNLPGNFIYSFFVFYYSIVIACILGLALFKSADKLNIAVE